MSSVATFDYAAYHNLNTFNNNGCLGSIFSNLYYKKKFLTHGKI
jgi:hypothetical protein